MRLRLVCLLISGAALRAQFGTPASGGGSSRANQLPLSGQTQNGSVTVVQSPAAAGSSTVNTLNTNLQIGGPYTGSASQEKATDAPIDLTLAEAIRRGLLYNLGPIDANAVARQARAQRLAALAQLLPDVNGSLRESVQQIDLAASGLKFSGSILGFSIPTIVGPFNYFDLRASLSQTVADLTLLRNWRASKEIERASALSVRDSRDLVVLAVTGAYLQLIASSARVDTAKAQIDTAQASYQVAADRNQNGLSARIDVNRSLVELQTQRQRLISLNHDVSKQRIALARIIGLPMTQAFRLTDPAPYREMEAQDVEQLVLRAQGQRPDVQAAAAQLRASELIRKAAVAEYYPSLGLTADYGVIGENPAQSHGTFSLAGTLKFPIWRSGRIKADIDQADAAVNQRKAEYENLKGQVEQEVRDAYLDLTAASEQIKVSESNRGLAAETLTQARDRFRAGVADTVEVVQAQESVATAEQDYIAALYAHNLARVTLARALGNAEQGVQEFLRGK